MADISVEPGQGVSEGPARGRLATVVQLAGGVVSMALIVGIGIWGTKMVIRDVSGVPVVPPQAEGPMRVAPENPGGAVTPHSGLAVNRVAAHGAAAGPEDRLVLAPAGVDLAAEDLEVTRDAEAGEVRGASGEIALNVSAPEGEAPLSAEDVLALADRIAAEAERIRLAPLDDVAADPAAAEPAEAAAPEVIPASVPGVSRSLRPVARTRTVPAAAAPETPEAAAAEVAVVQEVPAGTKLVQLGAFESPGQAMAEWQRLTARFSELLATRDPVVQQAQSGGRTFYRLRTGGFADLADARRLCSALVAADAPCIPVVVR